MKIPMKPGHVGTIAAFVLGALMCPETASAWFTLCNRSSQDKLIVAIAATWYTLGNNGARVIDASSVGWMSLAKGTCADAIASKSAQAQQPCAGGSTAAGMIYVETQGASDFQYPILEATRP